MKFLWKKKLFLVQKSWNFVEKKKYFSVQKKIKKYFFWCKKVEISLKQKNYFLVQKSWNFYEKKFFFLFKKLKFC